MENTLEYKLVHNYKCKRCSCSLYDKIIYTGMKTLDEEKCVIEERYVCRNCNYPFNVNEYLRDNSPVENISITPKELLNNSIFTDEGAELKINDETIIKEK